MSLMIDRSESSPQFAELLKIFSKGLYDDTHIRPNMRRESVHPSKVNYRAHTL